MSDIDLAREAVRAALAAGATSADVVVLDGASTSVTLREKEIEQVEHARSRALGVRAFRGKRTGIAYSNDATSAGAAESGARAAALSEVAADDSAAGLPGAFRTGVLENDLDLVDGGYADWNADDWAALALRAEAAARGVENVAQTDSARAGGGISVVTLANSDGFAATRKKTTCFVACGVYAADDGDRQRGDHHAAAAHLADLGEPEEVGVVAGQRAAAALGPRRPASGPFPVVLAPRVARGFAGTLASAVSAAAVYRRQTFLAEQFGQMVAAPAVTLVDDATLPRRMGSRPFDGEGVKSGRTVLFDGGRLASWMADCYSARRTGFHTTANASRGASGGPRVSTSNLILQPGDLSPAEILQRAGTGLYVTQLFGFGVNLATGTWSRGGAGRWIENGELTDAVHEFTVAGDLREILRGVAACGNDLEWSGSSAAPTVLIDGLTVASG